MTADTTHANARATTAEVFFDTLPAPAENMIGEEGKGCLYIPSKHVLGLPWFD